MPRHHRRPDVPPGSKGKETGSIGVPSDAVAPETVTRYLAPTTKGVGGDGTKVATRVDGLYEVVPETGRPVADTTTEIVRPVATIAPEKR